MSDKSLVRFNTHFHHVPHSVPLALVRVPLGRRSRPSAKRQSAGRIVNGCRIVPRGEGRTLTRCRVTIPAGLGQERPVVVARKREFLQLRPLVEMPDSFSTLLRGPSVPRPFPSLRPVFAGPIHHAVSPRTALCPLALVRLRLSSGTPSYVPLCVIYTTSHYCHPAEY